MFDFKLVSISGTKFDGQVYEVTLPTKDGQIGVLAEHMPLVSVAVPGMVIVKKNARDTDNDCEYFAINGGAIDVADSSLRVLVDEAEQPDEINAAEVQRALERATKMKAEAKDEISLEHAQSLIDRSEVRLQVASLKRRHK